MLKGKSAVVTGASRGIGREIALEFAKQGAKVVVNYNGSKENAEKIVDEIKNNGGEAVAFKANVANFEEAKNLIDFTVKEYGKVDILVNNAGITKDNLVMKMTEDDFDAVININLKGTFNCIKNVYRIMLKQKAGRIINMSSVVGISGNAGQANYSASKAGVIGITKSIAKELGSRGITVNAIAPGFIQTDMTDAIPEKIRQSLSEQIPLKRFGQTKDIANLATFLASDNASYITGQVIQVDGGLAI